MKYTGYLFNAGVTVSQMLPSGSRGDRTLQTWDTCVSAIVCAEDGERAQKIFENWCQSRPGVEDPPQTEIKKVVRAEVLSKLITESGEQALDWPEVARRTIEPTAGSEPATTAEISATTEDPGQGYWVDVNRVVAPESVGLDIESLKRELPDDIPSALNWSAEPQFIFLVSSLSPPTVMAYPDDIEETDFDDTTESEPADSGLPLDESVTALPEMREKDAVALVQARNSVVAGWLFRKFVSAQHLRQGEILVSPCCQIVH